jgi:hypothetical protein
MYKKYKKSTLEDFAAIVFIFLLFGFAGWFVEGIATFLGA